jgi:site-specific recombinase XerD
VSLCTARRGRPRQPARRQPALTCARAIALFDDTRRRLNCADTTRELERRVLGALLPRLGAPLAGVRREHVDRLLADRAREVAASTLARELGTLRACFGVLVDEGHLDRDPTAGLVVARGHPRPPLLVAHGDVARLLAVAADARGRAPRHAPAVRQALALRDRACLELLYGLGLRAAEVHAARTVDLVLAPGQDALLVRRAKRGEPRQLPLPPSSAEHLARYLHEGRPHLARGERDEGRLLLTVRGTPVRPEEVLRIVSKLARRAQVRAHPHALRRALATHLVLAGASLVAVQELLGHVNLTTTQRYVVVERHELRRAVDALEGARAAGV